MKWTPNIGQGGNNAIEIAATLANVLTELASAASPRGHTDIEKKLATVPQRRKSRAKATFEIANLVTRLEALKGSVEKFLIFYVMPLTGDWLANQMALGVVGSEKLNYLPDPPRSFSGTMAFNQGYGPGTTIKIWRRIFIALPLLLMAYATQTMSSAILSRFALQTQPQVSLTSGLSGPNNTYWDFPIKQYSPMLVTAFSLDLLNVDQLKRHQEIPLIVDFAPLWLIWILESHRRANTLKLFTIPALFGIAFQLLGIGVVGPVWFFLHYVQSPLADHAALDWRMVNVAAAKTALIAVILGLLAPTFVMYLLPDPDQRLVVNILCQSFPLITIALHLLLRNLAVKDTTTYDRIYNVEADLLPIRQSVVVLAAAASVVSIASRLVSDTPLSQNFVQRGINAAQLLSSQNVGVDRGSITVLFLQLNEFSCFTAAFLWLIYLISDLKAAGMTATPWSTLALCWTLGTLTVGPGATVVLTWLWRENLLARKKAKGAAVPPIAMDSVSYAENISK